MAGLPPELRCAGESVRLLLLGRVLAVAQMVLPLSVPFFPQACPLGDGEPLTQAGSDLCQPEVEMEVCSVPLQSELRGKYGLVTGHISVTT